jgi:hypothetical protein
MLPSFITDAGRVAHATTCARRLAAVFATNYLECLRAEVAVVILSIASSCLPCPVTRERGRVFLSRLRAIDFFQLR